MAFDGAFEQAFASALDWNHARAFDVAFEKALVEALGKA